MLTNVYGRLDFGGGGPDTEFDLVVNLESWAADRQRPGVRLRLDVQCRSAKIRSWKVSAADEGKLSLPPTEPPEK